MRCTFHVSSSYWFLCVMVPKEDVDDTNLADSTNHTGVRRFESDLL